MFYGNDYILNKRKIAYPYSVTTAAAAMPVSLADVKCHLRLDVNSTGENSYLTMLINAATNLGEKYTGRDFINKVYTTYRDNFIEPLELRKSKVSAIGSISYLLNGVLTTVSSSVYGFTTSNDYPEIYLKENQVWPDDVDNLPQAIKIVFTSGYGTSDTSVPDDIKMALLNHIADLYANRGDCNEEGAKIPRNSKLLYDSVRIVNIGSYQRDMSYFRGY